MKRIRVPIDVQAEVLFKAEHICSICHSAGSGVQIAHIDDNNQNFKEDNLIVLCLQHHDEVHKKSPLSKGFSKRELKKYKKEREEIVRAKRLELRNIPLVRLIRFDGVDNNTIYAEFKSRVLRNFVDPLTFELLGFNWGDVDIYPDNYKDKFIINEPLSEINKCRKIRIKFSNGQKGNEVYVVWDDGKKHHIPDPETLEALGGWEDIEDLDYKEFNVIPHGQPLLDIFSFRTKELFREGLRRGLR